MTTVRNRGLSALLYAIALCLCGSAALSQDCDGSCTTAQSFLTEADVRRIISQAVNEARARNALATIAVTDRVGNVLGVYRMGDPLLHRVQIASRLDSNGRAAIDSGLEGLVLPTAAAPFVIDDQVAITKAITGAYLSSEGNAFSSRTASQIVQENFNPGEINQPGGPLFGVQFSQLACSDFSSAATGTAVGPGPQRSPLGLAADPGGLPLYKQGSLVGGIGVIADGLYSLDPVITDQDFNLDELIAVAGTVDYQAPRNHRADRITVEGKTLRFSDVDERHLASQPQSTADIASLGPDVGQLVAVFGYSDGSIKAGTAFGQPESGIRPDSRGDFPGLDAFVFVNDANVERYPPTMGSDGDQLAGAPLREAEVRTILQQALTIANRARAQIRRPLGSQARISLAVVDTHGEVLGMVRSRDAPVFGSDVALQKARTAAFYSSAQAADFLRGLPPVNYLTVDNAGVLLSDTVHFSDYVTGLQVFLGDASALTNGFYAFSDRAGGNLSRPIYPDGLLAGHIVAEVHRVTQ
ncbi:MAG: heme-binding protein, partial [Gammaproteobacteria bacterium]